MKTGGDLDLISLIIDNYKNNLKEAYPAVDASKNSFGHSGFTGTFAWADPDNGLLYIFMSNRVNPTRNNPGYMI